MTLLWALRPARRTTAVSAVRVAPAAGRCLHVDHRNRLTQFWVPPPAVSIKDAKDEEEANNKLVRVGYVRKAHAGLFHMLPLGLRVQDKIEAVVDKHMRSIGASRVALSSISSAALWKKSGRLADIQSELFRFNDRKAAQYLLAPTHEEEITALVAASVQSYRDLPIRLYQITRKYRDEMRPRHGIVRAREFSMKDLYTFDATVADALATYEQVRRAYAAIFAELRLPVVAAQASSGDMGGDLSHEYHLAAPQGEDDVAHCTVCGFVGNTEIVRHVQARREAEEAEVEAKPEDKPKQAETTAGLDDDHPPRIAYHGRQVWRGISRDRFTLVHAWYPSTAVDTRTGQESPLLPADVDVQPVADRVPDLDTARSDVGPLGRDALLPVPSQPEDARRPRLVHLVDSRLGPDDVPTAEEMRMWPGIETPLGDTVAVDVHTTDTAGRPLALLRARTGDDCPACAAPGALVLDRGVELGHTFYLGTRYTDPLGVRVRAPGQAGAASGPEATPAPFMGCYGIGISRLLGAVADHLGDERGLAWPRAIAPFEAVVVPAGGNPPLDTAAEAVYDELTGATSSYATEATPPIDTILDDRPRATLPYKLKDADLTGYPVLVVIGGAWRRSLPAGATVHPDALCEVQCRRLGIQKNVPLRDLRAFVTSLLDQL